MATFEHKGYVLQQSDYNNHFMIFKDDKMVYHAQYDKKLTEDEAKEEMLTDIYYQVRMGV